MDKIRPLLLVLILALGAFLYWPANYFDFAYDDHHQILNRQVVTDATTSWINAFSLPTFPGDLYRPVSVLSYRLNYQFFSQGDATTFHQINLALYILVCFFVYLLSRKLGQSFWEGVVLLALFTLHPIHIEAVANIVGRAELLAAMFSLGAFLIALYLRPGFLSTCLVFLFSLFAFGSKESAIVLVALLPLAIWTFRDKFKSYKEQILMAFCIPHLAAFVYLGARFVVLSDILIKPTAVFYSENPLLNVSFFDRIIPSFKLLGDYILALLAPINLAPDYSQGFNDFWLEIFSLQGALSLSLVALVLLTIYHYRRDRLVFFWGLWFLIAFIPTINLLFPIGTIRADRLAFYPSIGFIGLVVRILFLSCQRSVVGLMFVSVGLLYCSLISQRLPEWKSNKTLFEAAVFRRAASPKAQLNLAMYYFHNEKNYNLAEKHFREAIILDPIDLLSARYLLDIMIIKKDAARIKYWAKKILELDPSDERAAKLWLAR